MPRHLPASVLGSIHVASRVACAPRTIAAILSVADRGMTEMDVGNTLKKIQVVYNKPIPLVDPKLLNTSMCAHYLQLPVRFEHLAQGYVDAIKKKYKDAIKKEMPASCPPATIAAVALVYTLSLTAANHCDQDILSRVSEASGVATCTLQTHLSAIEKIDAKSSLEI